MVRTRNAAAALAGAGLVRLNGKRVTAPSQPVRIGDVVTLALDRAVKVIQVEAFCEKRGAAPAARALYRDLTTSSGAKACT
jgi:ribosome-associated heat shock protein Hsp15